MAKLYDNRLIEALPAFSLAALEERVLGTNTKQNLLQALKEKYDKNFNLRSLCNLYTRAQVPDDSKSLSKESYPSYPSTYLYLGV
jgi:hypothetical protein